MERIGTSVNRNIRGDFHSHILPGMDDGASESNISVAMLMRLKQQNMDFVCLTPHYSYHRESIEHFLERRANSYWTLEKALRKQGLTDCVPQMILGAEVSAEADLAEEPDLQKLCCTGTNVLLLELPFTKLENRVYEAVENITLKYRIIPVIAHFERYRELYGWEERERILSLPNVVIQINAEAMCNLTERRFVLSLLSQGVPVILGSDAHGIERRPPEIEKAYCKIDMKLKEREKKDFYQVIRVLVGQNTCF